MLTKLCITAKTGEQQEALNANKRASLPGEVNCLNVGQLLEEVTLTKQGRPVRVDLGQNSKGKGIYLTKGLFL